MVPLRNPTSILLIDADREYRRYWKEGLERLSPAYQILKAPDGQSGLEVYRSQHLDCVIIELDLPDMSGFSIRGVGPGHSATNH